MSYPDVTPHGLPQEISDNAFVVYGSIRRNALLRFTRNMAIVRSGDELTLINPVRMDEDGLSALERLGNIGHVLRLGPFHGMDDQFYVDHYGAQMWGLPGNSTYTAPAVDRILAEGGELPFPDADFFAFRHMIQPEGAILLKRSTSVLLTTDAIQSYVTPPHYPYTSLAARIMLPRVGFPRKTLIGPIWMKVAVTDRDGMKSEFRRLLALDFDRLLSAHGVFLPGNAKKEVEGAFKDMFGEDP